jgi:hypothetical protein
MGRISLNPGSPDRPLIDVGSATTSRERVFLRLFQGYLAFAIGISLVAVTFGLLAP